MEFRPRRSALYAPGSNARALEKVKTLDADVLIFDLEDAVAPEAKEAARRQVVEHVRAGGFGRREVVIRINALGTPWGEADLDAAISAAPDAVLVPKVSDPKDLVPVEYAIAESQSNVAIWAMMETPRAMLNALAIADARQAAAPSLAVLVMGTNDLAKDTRANPAAGRGAMLAWLSTCLAAARAAGLDILDGVFNAIRDEDGFMMECRAGRDLGMDGKTLIHPSQIGPANTVFAPDAEAVAAARRIVAAFDAPENRNANVLSLDGAMVERLHAESARRTLAVAAAIEGSDA